MMDNISALLRIELQLERYYTPTTDKYTEAKSSKTERFSVVYIAEQKLGLQQPGFLEYITEKQLLECVENSFSENSCEELILLYNKKTKETLNVRKPSLHTGSQQIITVEHVDVEHGLEKTQTHSFSTAYAYYLADFMNNVVKRWTKPSQTA